MQTIDADFETINQQIEKREGLSFEDREQLKNILKELLSELKSSEPSQSNVKGLIQKLKERAPWIISMVAPYVEMTIRSYFGI